ncbi:MAG: 23S rRNA (pseudouridine(1915)-N(3))-methyltransferase RlmH [Heliobacteriaceae bacterium]|nr:23S rRNA (pseudouridine(1915)-N(3))-methyltransferase RlmH [Heliobacteriaceae bacterium]MDD4587738.1 23S rRNA (pseudouridine(1915)-N(3))-methyltransferase RlmH [Heliobacteriaceae bacterium]
MRVVVAAVGRIKAPYLQAGLREYEKRLGAYVRLTILEANEEKVPDHPSANEARVIKSREGQRLLAATARVTRDALAVALDPAGEMWSSEELAKRLSEWEVYGSGPVVFYLGGTLGLAPEVLATSRYRWSLSRLTFPHQLARLMVAEQVYRAYKIIRGEIYHR